jgi:putative nucleotidyltransferase with HDIG domain|nr:HD-GYP domain-containing protein [Candidatus Krumholzibacteria bacterium]
MEKQFSDLIILLASGINQRIMYFDNHPKVQAQCVEFKKRLIDLLDASDEKEFTFGVFNGKFIRHRKYLVGPSIAGRSLIRFAERMQCGGFAFSLPLEIPQLVAFYRLAAEQTEPVATLEEARQRMDARGLSSIRLLLPYTEGKREGGASRGADGGREGTENSSSPGQENLTPSDGLTIDFAPLLNVYQALYETVNTNNRAAGGDARVDLDSARSRGEELVAVSDQGALDVMQFMRYPDYDSYTIGHSVRVAALASLIGRELGWAREQRVEVATAGLLHDLGKGRIPEEILFKPGKLDADERSIMETHPVLGARILLANGETSSAVLSAAWGHHLRQDGKGYPRIGQTGEPGVTAALIHVCDVFEALTATRPYKMPLPPRKAYEIMLQDRGAFRTELVAALFRSMGLYPPGSEVLLNDFRRAVVVAQSDHAERPRIRITHEYGGLPLPAESQVAIDLDTTLDLEIQEFLAVGLEEPAGSAL